jgi:hypothetical protein
LHTTYKRVGAHLISIVYLPRGTIMSGKARIDLIHGQGWPAYLSSITGHTLVFAGFGPAIGAIASPGVILFPLAVITAYAVSFFAAVSAGLIIGMVTPFIRSGWLYPVSGLIGAACGVLIPFGLVAGMQPFTSFIAFYAIAGGVAAMVCTRMTRSVRRTFGT